jgi:iron complex outermembrane receptor protein
MIHSNTTSLRMSPRRGALLVAVGASALMWASTATAQSAPPKDSSEVEAVVVTGFRSSLEKALEVKRANTAAVDSIVAEDIAKFPDNNLAEAIQRVPGVAITRDGGEGRNLSVRGLSEEFTRVRINGVEAQATTGSNRGRGFDFNVFASELFSQIDVRKTPSADVEEGSLGATVDLKTGHPFDYRGFKMAGSAKMGWNDLSKSYDPRMALLVSNTFKDDTFGALFSVAYSEKGTRQNGASTGLWNQGNRRRRLVQRLGASGLLCAGADPVDTATASLATTRYPRFLRYQQYELEDQASGPDRFAAVASDRPHPGQLRHAVFEVQRRAERAPTGGHRLQPRRSQGGKPETVVRDMALDNNGTMVYGLFDNVDLRSENYLDKYSTEFTQWTLNAKHQLTDKWSVTGLVGYVANDFDNALDYIAQMDRQNSDGYAFDFRPSGQYFPAINYGFDVTDPNAWYIGPTVTAVGGTGPTGPDIRLRPNWNDNKYKVAQFDTEYDVQRPPGRQAGREHQEVRLHRPGPAPGGGRRQHPGHAGRFDHGHPDRAMVRPRGLEAAGRHAGLLGQPSRRRDRQGLRHLQQQRPLRPVEHDVQRAWRQPPRQRRRQGRLRPGQLQAGRAEHAGARRRRRALREDRAKLDLLRDRADHGRSGRLPADHGGPQL